jgi:hypothetical protein
MKDLLLQALEHERSSELVYDAALECVLNEDLEEEWEDCLERTERHVELLTEACDALDVDPDEMTASRRIAQHSGNALVLAMRMALDAGDADAAELLACECVLIAESRNDFSWELIADCAGGLNDEAQAVLVGACEEVSIDHDEHLHQTRELRRELWLQALGLDADLQSTSSNAGGAAGLD